MLSKDFLVQHVLLGLYLQISESLCADALVVIPPTAFETAHIGDCPIILEEDGGNAEVLAPVSAVACVDDVLDGVVADEPVDAVLLVAGCAVEDVAVVGVVAATGVAVVAVGVVAAIGCAAVAVGCAAVTDCNLLDL